MKVIISCILIFLTWTSISSSSKYDNLKLNEIQIIGSHNSYKVAIDQPLIDYLAQENQALLGLEYDHIPLREQLDMGLRSLELDIFYDPQGGYYSEPKGLEIVRGMGKAPKPFDEDGKLKEPGLKVFHVQEIDFRSHHLLFQDALMELKNWSVENEGHIPVIITLNAKDGEIPKTRKPLPFTAEALFTIDDEIKEVFSEDKLILPDLIRGEHKTLKEAVLTKGWPRISDVGGRFMFVLDEKQEKTDAYLSNFDSGLKNAVLFVNKPAGDPNAAFMIINNPIADFDKIKEMVDAGYIVRTRADADTREARQENYSRFEKAKASGAQVITTDYYIPSKLFPSTFKVVFDDGNYVKEK
jgi:hypothetical protein